MGEGALGAGAMNREPGVCRGAIRRALREGLQLRREALQPDGIRLEGGQGASAGQRQQPTRVLHQHLLDRRLRDACSKRGTMLRGTWP